MNFEIFNWAADRKASEVIAVLGYEHRQVVEGDVLKVANDFLDKGVNVMILRSQGPVNFTLAIDSKSFGQR